MSSREPDASPLLLSESDDDDYLSHPSSPFHLVSTWCKTCNWINTCKCSVRVPPSVPHYAEVTFTVKVMKMPLTKDGIPDKRFKYVRSLE